jgi:hypothetical protein
VRTQRENSHGVIYDSIQLWLDDWRTPPDGWVWVKRADTAIALIEEGEVDAVDLDFDLSVSDKTGATGLDVAKAITKYAMDGEGKEIRRLQIHSESPEGKKQLKRELAKARAAWVQRRNQ